MKVLFMVRRPYYAAIVAGTKTEEIRKRTKRWATLALNLGNSMLGSNKPAEAVFLCGRDVHRRHVVDIEDDWESAEAYFAKNRPEHKLSAQGKKDLGTGPVIVFYLGTSLDPIRL